MNPISETREVSPKSCTTRPQVPYFITLRKILKKMNDGNSKETHASAHALKTHAIIKCGA